MQRSADSKLQYSLQPEQVTWPPPESNDRIGGYKFLGGEAEAFCSLREIGSVAIRQACGLWAHRQAILLISRALGKFEFAMKVLVQRAASAFLRTVLPFPALAGGGGAESDPGRNRQPGTRLEVRFCRVGRLWFWFSRNAGDTGRSIIFQYAPLLSVNTGLARFC